MNRKSGKKFQKIINKSKEVGEYNKSIEEIMLIKQIK